MNGYIGKVIVTNPFVQSKLLQISVYDSWYKSVNRSTQKNVSKLITKLPKVYEQPWNLYTQFRSLIISNEAITVTTPNSSSL